MKIRKKVEGLMNKVDNLTAFEQKGNRLEEEIKKANKTMDKANVDLKHLENTLKEIGLKKSEHPISLKATLIQRMEPCAHLFHL